MENLNLNQNAIFYLENIRKWTRFISIFLFIWIGLMVILGFFMGFVMNMLTSMAEQPKMPLPGSFFTVFYILMALVYFFPVLYLFRFSENLGRALQTGMEEELTTAFRYLKSHYNYIGVLLIIGLALMVLFIIIAVIVMALGFSAGTGGDFL